MFQCKLSLEVSTQKLVERGEAPSRTMRCSTVHKIDTKVQKSNTIRPIAHTPLLCKGYKYQTVDAVRERTYRGP